MKQINPFRVVLSDASLDRTEQLEHFALLNLGMVESLVSGVLSAKDAIQRFYYADNCLYVRKHLRNNQANAIMSRGVQLPDIFDCLPTEEAQREFLYELEMIRSLCLKLLEKGRSRRVANRAAGYNLNGTNT
ncbi:MAG: hypothetical protein GY850_38140 [bacterium]|nr:hypothetical protein [bacterium]